MQRYFG